MLIFTVMSTIGIGTGIGCRLTAGESEIFCLLGGVVLVFYNERSK